MDIRHKVQDSNAAIHRPKNGIGGRFYASSWLPHIFLPSRSAILRLTRLDLYTLFISQQCKQHRLQLQGFMLVAGWLAGLGVVSVSNSMSLLEFQATACKPACR